LEGGDLSPLSSIAFCPQMAAMKSGDKSPHSKSGHSRLKPMLLPQAISW
jgi:hypothetical protein